MRTIWVIMLLGVALLTGCSAMKLSPQEQTYLREVMATPLTFELAEESAGPAWERARQFLETYGSTAVQTASDSILQTAPPGRGFGFRYYLSRRPTASGSQFSVECLAADLRNGPMADRNARILALYMQTGELPFPDLIAR